MLVMTNRTRSDERVESFGLARRYRAAYRRLNVKRTGLTLAEKIASIEAHVSTDPAMMTRISLVSLLS
jgi:hypothetical protein